MPVTRPCSTLLVLSFLIAATSCAPRSQVASSSPAPKPLPQLATPVAPGDLLGVAIDDSSGVPIAFARVMVYRASDMSNPADSAQADSLGRFAIRGLGGGHYAVRIRSLGYCTWPIDLRLSAATGFALIAAVHPARCQQVADLISCSC